MVEFMVLSAPRSASTWAANWLTTAQTLCLHDPILEHMPEEMDAIPCDRILGVACTGLGLLSEFVNQHPARKLVLHRDLAAVNESLETIGLSAVGPQWAERLTEIEGVHADYADLFDPGVACYLYEHLTHQPFDAPRHAQLCAMYVEPRFERIAIKPDRARDFRDRVQRAFH